MNTISKRKKYRQPQIVIFAYFSLKGTCVFFSLHCVPISIWIASIFEWCSWKKIIWKIKILNLIFFQKKNTWKKYLRAAGAEGELSQAGNFGQELYQARLRYLKNLIQNSKIYLDFVKLFLFKPCIHHCRNPLNAVLSASWESSGFWAHTKYQSNIFLLKYQKI